MSRSLQEESWQLDAQLLFERHDCNVRTSPPSCLQVQLQENQNPLEELTLCLHSLGHFSSLVSPTIYHTHTRHLYRLQPITKNCAQDIILLDISSFS